MLSTQNRVEPQSRPRSRHAHFEDLLTELAGSLVDLEPSALDARIVFALEEIVRFLGVDRAAIGRLDLSPDELVTSHVWAMPGMTPTPARVEQSGFPYFAAQLRSGLSVACDRLANLPASAVRDRESLLALGIRSIATVPLEAAGESLGWVAVSAIGHEHQWSPDQLRRLRLLAGVFASALLRQKKDLKLRAALAENMALRRRIEADNAALREEVRYCHDFEELVGDSRALRQVLKQVEHVAPTDSTVLILGETGTGKDLIATAIHDRSRRAERPLVRLNCAALPATLIESELFGHEKGAFTGALTRKIGRFEVADGGTIVLDEIGELPLELQAKLLRVLQSGELERLGSSATRRTDARVIASTNRDLLQMAREGSFRADLFYRLSVFPITIPPLRERKEDIPLLTAYFVDKLRGRLGRRVTSISDEALAELTAYDWPGNVRELENVVERSMIVSMGEVLQIDSLSRSGKPDASREALSIANAEWRTLEEVERAHILWACERCDWRISGKGNVADRLGVNPSTLRSRMQKLGIARPASVGQDIGDPTRLRPSSAVSPRLS